MRRTSFLRVVALVTLAGLSPVVAQQSVVEKIVFQRFQMIGREIFSDIFVMDVDGRHVQQLTRDRHSGSPAWSPDGAQIAFVSGKDGRCDVNIMAADGSSIRTVLSRKGSLHSLAWSPDGGKIAFDFYPPNKFPSDANVYVVDVDGSNLKQLTKERGKHPAWSPDGTQIAFVKRRGKNSAIYVMNVDGSNPHPLTDGKSENAMPSWSPDGKRIAFVSNRDRRYHSYWNWHFQIYVMNADGTGVVELTTESKVDCWSPSWSPDGRRIAFGVNAMDRREIFIMNADGSAVRQLTHDSGSHPSFGRVPATR